MPSFNLVEAPWIPCLPAAGGSVREVGILEALARAPDLREVVDPSPLVTVAIHRLLLAVLHRVFGPADSGEWSKHWRTGEWDEGKIADYLATWRERFDLFSPERPFYQVAGLDGERAVSAAKLTHELAAGNNPTLFDHTTPDRVAMTPAQAARSLLACQAFAVGGLVSFERAEDRSADGAPMVKGAVVLMRGENLFQTLILNLHWYNPRDEAPFPVTGDDRPAWERDEETRPEDREPCGHLDLLTWQGRRVRLVPEVDEKGDIVVRRAVIMKGNQFPDGFHRHGKETMVAFTKREKAKSGEDPWPPVGFQPDRVLWRDSLALLESLPEKRARPKTIEWLSDLVAQGVLTRERLLPVDVLGMASDQAKVLLWRHERLTLPLAYLGDKELVGALGEALALAEAGHRALRDSTRTLARLLAKPTSDAAGAKPPPERTIEPFATHLSPTRSYWGDLEVPFRRLLLDLADDRVVDEDEGVRYGGRVLSDWALTLRRTAVRAFARSASGLEGSPRAAKARATAENELRRRLGAALKDYAQTPREVIDGQAN